MTTIPEKFTMEFKPSTIEHLGLKLYVYLPPVIGELISNSWDADATKVEVTIPDEDVTEDFEIVIRDHGKGMTPDEIQDCYLPIGRNCRDDLGKDVSDGGRPLMGRKGIGKLSAFGVASILQIRSIKNGFAVCIELDYEDMKEWPKKHLGEPYEPKIIQDRCGKTDEKDGTEVRIRNLHRRSPVNVERIRKRIARRFAVIGDKFEVVINTAKITPVDRRLKEDCRKYWNVSELPGEAVVDEEHGWSITGWIGIIEKASQTERGVDVFARGKSVELETMFDLKTTHIQFARAYVVGEIHAEFLDSDDDNISTGRNTVDWESYSGQKLEEWGQKALLFVFKEWLAMQKKEKEKKVVKVADFDKWLKTRTPREQKVAQKLIKTIVDDQDIEPESAEPLINIIKTNVEFQAFQELVDEIEDVGVNVPTFLKLFQDWRIIEAREHLRLSDGRLEVMEKLSDYVKKGALEVKQIQPLFEENGWLVNPYWGEVTGQTRYTKLLRENCKESKTIDEKDRRIDILGYSVGGAVHVVELKRPEKTLSRGDLEQIEKYVDWARANIMGTSADSPKYISGLLIVGKLNSDKAIQEKMTRLAGSDIRVATYDDLLQQAETIYGEVENRLRKIAPEYCKEARRKRKKS